MVSSGVRPQPRISKGEETKIGRDISCWRFCFRRRPCSPRSSSSFSPSRLPLLVGETRTVSPGLAAATASASVEWQERAQGLGRSDDAAADEGEDSSPLPPPPPTTSSDSSGTVPSSAKRRQVLLSEKRSRRGSSKAMMSGKRSSKRSRRRVSRCEGSGCRCRGSRGGGGRRTTGEQEVDDVKASFFAPFGAFIAAQNSLDFARVPIRYPRCTRVISKSSRRAGRGRTARRFFESSCLNMWFSSCFFGDSNEVHFFFD